MKQRFWQFDLAKFILIFLIADVFHYKLLMGSFITDNYLLEIISSYSAYTGINLMFQMSGFLAVLHYEKRIETKELSFQKFLGGRVKRLYPMMFVTTLFVVAMQIINERFIHVNVLKTLRLSDIILNILGMQTGWISDLDERAINGPTWYISVLMICYFWMFIFQRWIKNKSIRSIAYIFMFVVGMISFLCPIRFPFLYSCCGRGYMGFFMGALLAKFYEREKIRKRAYGWIAGILLIVFYMLSGKSMGSIYGFTVLNCGLFLLLFGVSSETFFLKQRRVTYLGDLSFGVYLWNIPILYFYILANESGLLSMDFQKKIIYVIVVGTNFLIPIIFLECKRIVGKKEK